MRHISNKEMKFNSNTALVQETTSKHLELIFPAFGTKAPEVPHFDADKHMYIVDQYTSAAGNRSITYVAVGRQLVVEFTVGLYHCWTLMNKVRLLIPNGTTLKVVKTFDWEGTTYFNLEALRAKITELATEYAMDNIGMVGGEASEQVGVFVGNLVGDLLAQNVDSQLEDNGLQILFAYCKQMNVCKDFNVNP